MDCSFSAQGSEDLDTADIVQLAEERETLTSSGRGDQEIQIADPMTGDLETNSAEQIQENNRPYETDGRDSPTNAEPELLEVVQTSLSPSRIMDILQFKMNTYAYKMQIY